LRAFRDRHLSIITLGELYHGIFNSRQVEKNLLRYRKFFARTSGVGLGLSISLKAAKANAGEIHVRDLPGKGCIFTLDLPRKPQPTMSDHQN